MIVYQIRDWDGHFENYKSRDVDSCGFVCVPNKQDGLGFTRIMAERDGASIYGIWCLILGACSRQRRPRAGWLTDDGRAKGNPWAVGDLALRWRRSAEEISRALSVLSSDPVGWIEKAEVTATAEVTAASSPAGTAQESRDTPLVSPQYLEGKEGNEQKEDCPEPQAASGPDADEAPLLFFPVVHRKGELTRWGLTRSHFNDLSSTFPDLDVLAEGRKALGWIVANPNRKKTARGMAKYLYGWMSRAQERGGVRLVKPLKTDETGFVESDWTPEQAAAIGVPWAAVAQSLSGGRRE